MEPNSLQRWWWLLCACGIAVWLYFHTISPRRAQRVELEQTSARLDTRIVEVRAEIKRLQEMEQQTAAARVDVERLGTDLPEGSPMVWTPERLDAHFARYGYPAVTVRFVSSEPVPELRHYQRMYWSIGLPWPRTERHLDKPLLATAELERSEPLFRVIDFATLPDQEHPGERVAVVTVALVVKE